ncbi:MAG: radical SAM protein, partial [bacterium]|nr:radical SAM protein [bacterium]
NVDPRFQELMDRYFEGLKACIVPDRQANINNLGNEVLRHHMMAYLNAEDKKECLKLLEELVQKVFYSTIQPQQAEKLNGVMKTFYERLEDYIRKLLEKEKPTVLGLTAYTVTLPACLFAFKLAKEIDPSIRTVMGGGIFSGELDMDSTNFQYFIDNTPFIDKIIVGEGEELFLKYLKGELPSDQRVYTLADIGMRTLELDKAPLVDFSDLDARYYTMMASYTSRSCPFNCSFCSEKVMWGKYRKKSGAYILSEIAQLSEKYKTQLFLMADSLLNPVVDGLSEAVIEAGASIYWDGYLRADKAATDRERTFKWRRGGFYRARLGLESGSPKVLELMGKQITPQQIKDAVSGLASAGIKTTTYWVIGHPGETEEDFQQTLDLIESMKDDIYEADCNPFMYFPAGQVHSDQWKQENKAQLLHSEESRRLLMLQTWILDVEPNREEIYRRVARFSAFCRKLGIPNPYSLRDIYAADERWKRLHANAAPAMADFIEGKNSGKLDINENRELKQAVAGKSIDEDLSDGWDF